MIRNTLTLATIVAVLFGCAQCIPVEGVSLPLSDKIIAKIGGLSKFQALRQTVQNNNCRVNFCFALDGSTSTLALDFARQIDFTILISAILSGYPNMHFAAVQYGSTPMPISRLTSNENDFITSLDKAKSSVTRRTDIGSGLTDIGSGLTWCINQFTDHRQDLNKIVLLGDGRSNKGRDPVSVADEFRANNENGSVCSVGVGFQDTATLKAIAGGADVLTIHDFFWLADTVELMIANNCNIPGATSSTAPVVRKLSDKAKNKDSYFKAY